MQTAQGCQFFRLQRELDLLISRRNAAKELTEICLRVGRVGSAPRGIKVVANDAAVRNLDIGLFSTISMVGVRVSAKPNLHRRGRTSSPPREG